MTGEERQHPATKRRRERQEEIPADCAKKQKYDGGDEDYVSVPGCVDNQENIGEKGRKQRKNKQAAGKNRQKEEDESLEKLQRDNQQLNEEKRELQAAVDKLMQKLHEADRENQSLLIINDQLRQWAGQAWLQ